MIEALTSTPLDDSSLGIDRGLYPMLVLIHDGVDALLNGIIVQAWSQEPTKRRPSVKKLSESASIWPRIIFRSRACERSAPRDAEVEALEDARILFSDEPASSVWRLRSAHYWARELKGDGHEVLLMPPAYTKPMSNAEERRGRRRCLLRSDSRPECASFHQERGAAATLMLHKMRELLVKQRTDERQRASQPSSEFGIIAARESAASTSCLSWPKVMRRFRTRQAGVKVLSQALEGLGQAIDDLEDEITSAHAQNEMTRFALQGSRHRKIISSVIDQRAGPSVFKSDRFRRLARLTPEAKLKRRKQTLGPSLSRATDT